jgi:D-amino peptidase
MLGLICVDIEGVSGLGNSGMLEDGVSDEAKRLATDDVLAAIRGIREAKSGVTVDVFDAHGMGGNLLEVELAEHCTLLGGGWMTTLRQRVNDGRLANYDFALLLGQHAGGGTLNGFMSHTNSMFVASRWNGMDAGEAPQLSWLLGHFGVPVGLVSGDSAVCREVESVLAAVPTVAVKTCGVHRGIAECVPPKTAHAAIETASAEAVELAPAPQTLFTPVLLEISFFFEHMADMAAEFPGYVRTGPMTVSYEAPGVLSAWHAYNASRVISDAGGKAELLRNLASVEAAIKRYREMVAGLNAQWLEGTLPLPTISR